MRIMIPAKAGLALCYSGFFLFMGHFDVHMPDGGEETLQVNLQNDIMAPVKKEKQESTAVEVPHGAGHKIANKGTIL